MYLCRSLQGSSLLSTEWPHGIVTQSPHYLYHRHTHHGQPPHCGIRSDGQLDHIMIESDGCYYYTVSTCATPPKAESVV